ncbi:hypothetical protein [Pseudoscardovia suis]
MAGIGEEKTDQELAAQEFTDPKAHCLTILQWNKHVRRRDWIAANLLRLCDVTHGDVKALTLYLNSVGVPWRAGVEVPRGAVTHARIRGFKGATVGRD